MVLRKVVVLAVALAAAMMAGCTAKKDERPDQIEISYTISGVLATVAYPANAEVHWDKFIPNASANGQLTASVTADRTRQGFMQCMITYQDSTGDVYIVDYVHDNSAGSITCRSDADKVASAIKNTQPITKAPGGGCGSLQGCPGPDSLNLNVTWFASK